MNIFIFERQKCADSRCHHLILNGENRLQIHFFTDNSDIKESFSEVFLYPKTHDFTMVNINFAKYFAKLSKNQRKLTGSMFEDHEVVGLSHWQAVQAITLALRTTHRDQFSPVLAPFRGVFREIYIRHPQVVGPGILADHRGYFLDVKIVSKIAKLCVIK